MSQLQQFLQLIQQDLQLQQQLAQAPDKQSAIQLLVEYAQQKGLNVTAADVQAFLEEYHEQAKEELSQEELEAVAGGSGACSPCAGTCNNCKKPPNNPSPPPKSCFFSY